MARRGDLARILEAQRAGTRARLVSAGVSADCVHGLLDAFLALPDVRGRPVDWEAAFGWALAQPKR
jgi:hypothetical protein